MAERAEVTRRLRDTPRRIQELAVLQTLNEMAVHIEDVHVTDTRTVVFIRASLFAVRKCHDEIATNVLNVEWYEVVRQALVAERVMFGLETMEAAVEDFHLAALKV